jgi:hypothetical protein
MDRRGKIMVGTEFLCRALNLPANHFILGAEWDFGNNQIVLTISGPTMPQVEPGMLSPFVPTQLVSEKTVIGITEHLTWLK